VGEGSALDRAKRRTRQLRELGDDDTADALGYIFGDELVHVRTAQRWLPRLIRPKEQVAEEVSKCSDDSAGSTSPWHL